MLVPRRVSGITFIWYAQNRTTVFNRIKLGTDGDCMPVLNGVIVLFYASRNSLMYLLETIKN
jgi:hypothetical protein